jgi:hypothetical protein
MRALPLEGRPIAIRFEPGLRAHRGKLIDGADPRGSEVHAASFVRRREIVFDTALRKNKREFARIFVHELFHFAWVRMANGARLDFERVIETEMDAGARGELGWSAETRKARISRRDRDGRSRAWRDYVCESFCDTAAWVYAAAGSHAEITLSKRFRGARRKWFERSGFGLRIPV